jgi:hypothetical protein
MSRIKKQEVSIELARMWRRLHTLFVIVPEFKNQGGNPAAISGRSMTEFETISPDFRFPGANPADEKNRESGCFSESGEGKKPWQPNGH